MRVHVGDAKTGQGAMAPACHHRTVTPAIGAGFGVLDSEA